MFTQFYEGGYYHVYNRGVDKRVIFLEDQDREFFLRKAQEFVFNEGRRLVKIGAYCLMDNHFHMLLIQESECGVTRYMRRLATSYVMYFNKKYKRTGTLFGTKYKRKHVSTDGYLGNLIRYIHLNPKDLMKHSSNDARECLTQLIKYPWSDLSEYVDGNGSLSNFFSDISYRDFVFGELLCPRSDLELGFEVGPQISE